MSGQRWTLGDLAAAQTRAGMARFAPNWLPCRVTEYHPPEVIDGTPFPASVTVQSTLEYVRVVQAPEDGAPPVRMAPGERVLAGEDAAAWTGAGGTSARWTAIARPYDPVRIPFISAGSSELGIISDPRVGDLGMLMLAGRSIADALASAAGDPVLPEFAPNPLRLSDGMYLGFLLAGDAGGPPEAQPVAGTAQLGPRDTRASSVYLRLAGEAWTLAGSAINLGDGTTKEAARKGDTIEIDPTSLGALNAALALIPAAPLTGLTGTITSGSGLVKVAD